MTVHAWCMSTGYHLSLHHFSKYSENVLIPVADTTWARKYSLAATHLPEHAKRYNLRMQWIRSSCACGCSCWSRQTTAFKVAEQEKHSLLHYTDDIWNVISIVEKTVPKLPNISSCEHGNRKALQHFPKNLLIWKKTHGNFKKAYQDKLLIQRQQGNVQVTSLERLPRGRPPLLLGLDYKLISFVKNLRARGAVVNGSVISAATKRLVNGKFERQE